MNGCASVGRGLGPSTGPDAGPSPRKARTIGEPTAATDGNTVLLARSRRVDSYACTWDPTCGEFRGVEGPRGFASYREAVEASRFLNVLRRPKTRAGRAAMMTVERGMFRLRS